MREHQIHQILVRERERESVCVYAVAADAVCAEALAASASACCCHTVRKKRAVIAVSFSSAVF